MTKIIEDRDKTKIKKASSAFEGRQNRIVSVSSWRKTIDIILTKQGKYAYLSNEEYAYELQEFLYQSNIISITQSEKSLVNYLLQLVVV